MPHHRSIAEPGADVDEERRLCYVGVTRAQRRLTLTMSLNRRKWGRVQATIPSRFLYELTGKADNPNYLAVKQGHKRQSNARADSGVKRSVTGWCFGAASFVSGFPVAFESFPARCPSSFRWYQSSKVEMGDHHRQEEQEGYFPSHAIASEPN